MEIKRAGSQLSAKGSSQWFTGTVRVDPLFEAPGERTQPRNLSTEKNEGPLRGQ